MSIGSTLSILARNKRKIISEAYKAVGKDALSGFRILKRNDIKKIGTRYGGWCVPLTLLGPESICYCAGVGEDITFDLGLIEKIGCRVYAFDPTPRAAQYVHKHALGNKMFVFTECGIWDADETLKFYAPSNPEHVSHSIVNLQSTTDFFEAPCKSIKTIMDEKGHKKLDLLKIDIEGAEYRVLDSILNERIHIGILCVEFDEGMHQTDPAAIERIKIYIEKLINYGYDIVAVDGLFNYTFLLPDSNGR